MRAYTTNELDTLLQEYLLTLDDDPDTAYLSKRDLVRYTEWFLQWLRDREESTPIPDQGSS